MVAFIQFRCGRLCAVSFPQHAVLNLFLQFYRGGSMIYFKENYIFLRSQRGPTFSRRCATFCREGVQMLI